MTLHFPPTVDSTILAAFRSCPQKAYRSYFQHYKPRNESVHLVAGMAYARGLEVARRVYYEQSRSPEEAEAEGLSALIQAYGTFECPPESAKSLERTCGALEYYFDQYPLSMDPATPIFWGDKRGIEFSFAEELDVLHPETGDPILYTGRSDMIVDFAGGVYLEDDKTASQLGPSWSKQWDLRSQFTGYTWAARKVGIDAKGVLVRGVSILKTKYDTQQCVSGRAPWEVDRWLAQTTRDVKRMIECWRNYQELGDAAFDYNLDHACAEYGGCGFVQICKSPNPQDWLPMYFEPRVWDPLARAEVSVEDYNKKWFGDKA